MIRIYGGSAPVVKGSVVLDVQIIEVNEELAYAIVEPGVSFFDLFNYIAEKGYALWPSTPALGWGSVVGNTLDRGFGYVPAGEHSQQQCGMEVVLPTGEIIRTGMGAMKASPMWPLYKGGYGLSLDGLFFQSNLGMLFRTRIYGCELELIMSSGVVTKIGMHMDPAPVCLAICEILVEHEQQLPALVSLASCSQRRNVIHGHVVIANPYRQACVSTDPELQKTALDSGTRSSCATNATLTALWQQKHILYWKAHFSMHGASLASVEANLQVIKNHISHDQNLPGAELISQHYIAKSGLFLNAKGVHIIDIPFSGVPKITAKDSLNVRGQNGGQFCFSPLFPSDGTELGIWFPSARNLVEEAGFDTFCDSHVFGRYTIPIILVIYTPEESARAKILLEKLVEHGKNLAKPVTGYRTHVQFMDVVREDFGWNEGAMGKLVDGIKRLVDPEGVLAMRKSGIWGKS